jgi:hypothetical protein
MINLASGGLRAHAYLIKRASDATPSARANDGRGRDRSEAVGSRTTCVP